MRDIEDNQAFVVDCITVDAHAVSTGPVDHIGMIYPKVDLAVVSANVAVIDCCVSVDVVYGTISIIRQLRLGVSLAD